MIGTIAVLHMACGAVVDRNLVIGKLRGVGCNLSHDGLEPLSDGRRSEIDRKRTICFKNQPRIFFRPGSPALDETPDSETVVIVVNQLAAQFALFGPSELFHAYVKHRVIVAAVELSR